MLCCRRAGCVSRTDCRYATHEVEGWVVHVSERLSQEQPEETKRALELLAEQLRIVIRVLPAGPLAFVRTVPIWFSPPYAGVRPKAEYHSDKAWLEKEGRLKELYQCVEFTTTAIFDREIERMPVIVLHELAHAYHYQVLGFDNALIKTAFERARNSGSYDAVLRTTEIKKKPMRSPTRKSILRNPRKPTLAAMISSPLIARNCNNTTRDGQGFAGSLAGRAGASNAVSVE